MTENVKQTSYGYEATWAKTDSYYSKIVGFNKPNKTTGSLAQGRSEGVLYWRIPETYSGGYRYQCTAHPAMVGSIQIKRFSQI